MPIGGSMMYPIDPSALAGMREHYLGGPSALATQPPGASILDLLAATPRLAAESHKAAPQTPEYVSAVEAARMEPLTPAPEPPMRVPLLSPRMTPELRSAFERAQEAVRQQGETRAQAAQQQAEAFRQALPDILGTTERYYKLSEQADELAREKMTAIERARERLRAARVDPNRLLAEPGKRIQAAIAIALSGIGNAIARRPDAPNHAYQIIQRAIDRDVQEQMIELQKRREELTDAQQEYRAVMDMFAGKAQKLMALRSLAMDNAAQRIKLAALESEAPAQRAAAELLASQLEIDRAKIDQQLHQQAQAANMQSLLALEKARAGEAAQIEPIGEYKPTAQAALLPSKAKLAARGEYNRHMDVLKLVANLKQLRGKYWSETLPGEAKTRMKVLGKMLQDKLKAIGLTELASGIDPTAYGYILKQLELIEEEVRQQLEGQMKVYGFEK